MVFLIGKHADEWERPVLRPANPPAGLVTELAAVFPPHGRPSRPLDDRLSDNGPGAVADLDPAAGFELRASWRVHLRAVFPLRAISSARHRPASIHMPRFSHAPIMSSFQRSELSLGPWVVAH